MQGGNDSANNNNGIRKVQGGNDSENNNNVIRCKEEMIVKTIIMSLGARRK